MNVDPAELKIQLYPRPVLREPASEVEYSENVREVAARMIEMMHSADGIGLAAPQVGVGWRVFVCHVPPSSDTAETDPPSFDATPRAFINPVIVENTGVPEPFTEGCLSLPGVMGDVMRQPEVLLRATGLDGEPFEIRAQGLLARCYLHEIDHLDGVLILDHMDERDLKRNRNLLKALERRAR